MLTPIINNNLAFTAIKPSNTPPKKSSNNRAPISFGNNEVLLPKNFTAAELAGMVQTLYSKEPTSIIQPQPAKQQFTSVRAQHILVPTLEKANLIKKGIESGEIPFEVAAKNFSTCPSGQNGGDLGFFEKGAMVKPFEDAAFSAAPNEIVGPVETQFGFHLIKVVERK
ncbi:MAG: peptidylprolyl isomerase [Cyanobacteriota bacterium]